MIRIAYTDFPPGFDPENNLFFHILSSIYADIRIVDSCDVADLIFVTIYGNNHPNVLKAYGQKCILWLGENHRPTHRGARFSISTDVYDYGGYNYRLPLWYCEIDWHGTGLGVVSPEEAYYLLVAPTRITLLEAQSKKFCIAIFNNPEPTRLAMLEALQGIEQVSCYGRPFGNWFPTDFSYRAKLEKMSEFAFNLCPENSYYPGYYTEKVVHAKLAKAIPLYMADPGLSRDFIPDSIINIYDYDSFELFARNVQSLYDDKEKLAEALSTPLLRTMPSITGLCKWIFQASETIMASRMN
jgi:hypothetical protein